MLIMMMAIITVWKEGPQSLKAVPAMRARPMATPAFGGSVCAGDGSSNKQQMRQARQQTVKRV